MVSGKCPGSFRYIFLLSAGWKPVLAWKYPSHLISNHIYISVQARGANPGHIHLGQSAHEVRTWLVRTLARPQTQIHSAA